MAGGWEPAPVFCIQAGEDTVMENIRFENLRIHAEESHPLAHIQPSINHWQRRKTPGNIRNVHFINVRVEGRPCDMPVWVLGHDEPYTVQGVRFENCRIFGQRLKQDSPGVGIGEHTKEIDFI